MFWGAISANGTVCLEVVSHKINSEEYTSTLSATLLPILKKKYKKFTFQQDNASCHVSKISRAWFGEHKINLLDWPPCSPDLNPIENVWGYLVHQVYPNFKSYSTIEELTKAVVQEWNKLNPDYISKLVNSMPDRLYQVIERQGKCTSY